MLDWDDAYSTGFPDIDDQHKQLFQVINRLGQRIDKGLGHEEIDEVLDFLEQYCKLHFGYEEECMAKHKCPFAGKNKTAHEQFVKGYHSYRERYEEHGATEELIRDIHQECERWLIQHICHVDIHLKDCLHKN